MKELVRFVKRNFGRGNVELNLNLENIVLGNAVGKVKKEPMLLKAQNVK